MKRLILHFILESKKEATKTAYIDLLQSLDNFDYSPICVKDNL